MFSPLASVESSGVKVMETHFSAVPRLGLKGLLNLRVR